MAKKNTILAYFEAPPSVKNAIKTLRTNIRFSSIDRDIKSIVITSVLPNEGKTTISIQLGIAMAESGLRTIIVNADCYKPFYAKKMGVQPTKTWLDVLYDDSLLVEAVTKTSVDNLYFIESDVKVANPVELVDSNRFQKLVRLLKVNFDIIIFDTPPLGTFIEASILASKSDGTILVFDSVGGVEEKKALNVIEQLNMANARLLGVVLNNVAVTDDDYYGYYNYRAQAQKQDKKQRRNKRILTGTTNIFRRNEDKKKRRKKTSVADYAYTYWQQQGEDQKLEK